MIRHVGAITAVGLSVLCALTWAYIVTGAGLGMSAWDMTTMAFLPQQHGTGESAQMGAMTPDHWGARIWILMVGMWWTMMIAMMTPSAAPTILLYARVHRHALAQDDHRTAPASLFATGYFLVWLAFSIAAAALQLVLQRAGIVSAATMGSQIHWISGVALIVTGLYQLSPLKNACLSHCRSPAAYLSRHWRPGASGALRLGGLHGAYCVGCCWMLMVLLFVGGVMNLAWIAALSLLVLAEKVLSTGRWVGRVAGAVMIGWGVWILLA